MTIDFMEIEKLVSTMLPTRARWNILGTPLDFDFSRSHFNHRRANSQDNTGAPFPIEWSGYRIFGRYIYATGGGAAPWIAIRESDGFICGLDAERQGSSIFIFNSRLDRFISTFQLFDRHFGNGQGLAQDVPSQARSIDADVFDRSEWRDLADAAAFNSDQPITEN